MSTDPQTELLSSLEKLFIQGDYSDLLIVCGSDQYSVHRAIVCPRSHFFAVACNGVFKEGNTGTINLDDDDPLAVKLMIHYLYHLDYPHQDDASHPFLPDAKAANFTFSKAPPSYEPPIPISRKKDKKAKKAGLLEMDSTNPPNLTVHAKVYALAEKYGIPGLKNRALEKFKDEADLRCKALDFLRAAEVVYTSTISQDRFMRDVVVETFCKHPDLLDDEAAQNIVRHRSDLCYDLMMRFRRPYTPWSVTTSLG